MGFDFYFAGEAAKELTQLMIQENANLLRSYMTERKAIEKLCEEKRNGWKGKLLVDNGAFTIHRKGGNVDIDEYINFINTHDEADYFIALDHIPGKWGTPRTPEEVAEAPIHTWENYLYMVDKVNKPEKLLPVFHQGENLKYLDQILKYPKVEYICISGNKELTNKQRESWYEECYDRIYELNPNIKVHCLGSATMSNARKYPFTSMDSTTYIMTAINGSIITPKKTIYVGDGGKSMSPEEREELQRFIDPYGFKVDELGDNGKARLIINFYQILNSSRETESVRGKVKTNRLI